MQNDIFGVLGRIEVSKSPKGLWRGGGKGGKMSSKGYPLYISYNCWGMHGPCDHTSLSDLTLRGFLVFGYEIAQDS